MIQWLATRDDEFQAKLAIHGLVAPRKRVVITKLGQFLDNYIDGRTDIKPNTSAHLKRARESPDNQWRRLFALCRFGGLRCPSEPLVLRWDDVDWEHDKIIGAVSYGNAT